MRAEAQPQVPRITRFLREMRASKHVSEIGTRDVRVFGHLLFLIMNYEVLFCWLTRNVIL